MQTFTPEELEAKRQAVPTAMALFDPERQQRQVTDFVTDLLDST